MNKTLLVSGIVSLLILAGCASMMKIANVGIPGSAKNAENKTVGNRTALRYFSDLSVEEACAEQVKLLTEAKWTESDPMSKEDTYVKTTYTDGKSDMVLLCSQTEVSATEKATKVTMTLLE